MKWNETERHEERGNETQKEIVYSKYSMYYCICEKSKSELKKKGKNWNLITDEVVIEKRKR